MMIYPLQKTIYRTLSRSWAQGKYERIRPHLNPGDKIIDLGAGKCALSGMLMENGFDVTPVDVSDNSFNPDIKPVIYNGTTLPFEEDTFDVALLLTVLHHTPDPDTVLNEALRTAKRIIVIEDVYENPAQKQLTYVTDSLFNCEFRGHPHTNRTHLEWLLTFDRLGLRVRAVTEQRLLLFYKQVMYHLEK